MKKTEKIFNVKEESIYTFFKENVIGCDHIENIVFKNQCGIFSKNGTSYQSSNDPKTNPYYLMKDEISVKKTYGFNSETIAIKLRDYAMNSDTVLSYEYVYKLREYDDVSNKYRLVDFRVDAVILDKK